MVNEKIKNKELKMIVFLVCLRSLSWAWRRGVEDHITNEKLKMENEENISKVESLELRLKKAED